ncbi:MAG: sulfur oxidation protein SoxY [Rubellimicrobium sp.]|nr:sulfur oxidation protein SoxY [Rubellimicrobium sp.]
MIDRRRLLAGAGGLAAIAVVPLPAAATPADAAAAITEAFGDDRPFTDGPIIIEAPALAETGNSVPITVRAERAMDAPDRITRMALFSENNPRAALFAVSFGPAAAEAAIATNIRLNGTQQIICVAETADGTLIRAIHEIRVVVSACTTLEAQF